MASQSSHSDPQQGSSSSTSLTRLPVELVTSIISHLSNRDIKNVRQTCIFFRDTVPLRLSRVFLSANPLNVSVFRAVADHDMYRKGITEIIWDDALLTWGDRNDHDDSELGSEDNDEWGGQFSPQMVPSWFSSACEENLEELRRRKGRDRNTPQHVMRSQQVESQLPLQESWSYYQNLVQGEMGVIASESDVEALRYGLSRFPSLKRITISPATHGWLYTPLYETPMIRAFPKGFNYRIPRGWPCVGDGDPPVRACPWNQEELIGNRWRGFRLITRELVQQNYQISDLLIDAHHLNTGLNCRVFEARCVEYDNLVTILKQPSFARLDLDLLVGGQEHQGWSPFRSGLLKQALSEATALEHISLRTDVVQDPDASSQVGSGGLMAHHIPLQTIFPTDKWPRLKHLGLSRFLVQQADVVSLLLALPPTIWSVELSFLGFLDHGGNYRDLLDEIREKTDWRHRAENVRPTLSIGTDLHFPRAGRAIWVDQEVYDFLYLDGENPFGYNGGSLNQVPNGKGTVRDAFDPSYERPWLDFGTYMKLGYYEGSTW